MDRKAISETTFADAVLSEVRAERMKQLSEYSLRHDDEHIGGELTKAAMSYCQSASVGINDTSSLRSHPPSYWPWHVSDWNPQTQRSDLIRAATLILAEIERVDRAQH